MHTYKYKLDYHSDLDAINAASASVWNECLILKEMWDYAHGYPTTSKACELWMDKQLSQCCVHSNFTGKGRDSEIDRTEMLSIVGGTPIPDYCRDSQFESGHSTSVLSTFIFRVI